jgi:hypothetical protein
VIDGAEENVYSSQPADKVEVCDFSVEEPKRESSDTS